MPQLDVSLIRGSRSTNHASIDDAECAKEAPLGVVLIYELEYTTYVIQVKSMRHYIVNHVILFAHVVVFRCKCKKT